MSDWGSKYSKKLKVAGQLEYIHQAITVLLAIEYIVKFTVGISLLIIMYLHVLKR